MEKKLAMKWVKALRSGKYKQAKSTLTKFSKKDENFISGGEREANYKPVGYCCLGVLCDVAKVDKSAFYGRELLEDGLDDMVGLGDREGTARDEETGDIVKIVLPVKEEGKINTKDFCSLAEANDNGVSFKRIASWIEKNYKLL